MAQHELQSTLNDMRASINDCIATLWEYGETDFGIDKTTADSDENPYRRLIEHLAISLYYVIDLSYRIDNGAPDQR